MILAAVLATFPLVAGASTDAPPPPATDNGLEQPQIIVRPAPAGKIEEYRMAGRLYMIKVTPDKGPGYYLVDSDGNGSLDTRKDGLGNHITVPQWVLKRWR
jgi:hypothetical protein